MILKNNKQNAFTIVELLIVIVVIGILASISIVAYNGIQNRARDSAVADAGKQIRSKIEIWYSIQGSYPSLAQINARLAGTGAPSEAEIPQDIFSQYTATSAAPVSGVPSTHAGSKPIHVRQCAKGATITYHQSTGNKTLRAGAGCP